MVINANAGIYIRRLEELDFVLVKGTSDAIGLFVSPDSEWIGYYTPTALMKVSVRGGTPQSIYQASLLSADRSRGASWADDGRIYFGGLKGIEAVSANGGNAEVIVAGDAHSPHALAGSRHILYVRSAAANSEVMLHSFDSADDVRLGQGTSPAWANGVVLMARGATLYAAPLDLRARRLTFEPMMVVEAVANLGSASQ